MKRNMLTYPATIQLSIAWVVYALAFFFSITTFAKIDQNVRFFHYSINDGISGSITDIVQDRYGFIWFGSDSGLMRFDGYDFKNYKPDQDNANSISDLNVYKIVLDNKKNVLWIATTNGGLNRYDIESDQFTHFKHNENNANSLAGNVLVSLTQDKNGVLWIGYNSDGVTRFNPKLNKFTRIFFNIDGSSTTDAGVVYNILADSRGTIWAATTKGVYFLDTEKMQFVSITSIGCSSVYEDKAGVIWVGARNGTMFQLDAEEKKIIKTYPPELFGNAPISRIITAPDNELWIATLGAGLVRFNPANNTVVSYNRQSDNPDSLRSNRIHSLYQTDEGILWLGYSVVGVSRLSYSQLKIRHLRHNAHNKNSLYDNPTSAIYEDRNKILWIASQASVINRIDRKNETVKHYPLQAVNHSNSMPHTIIENNNGDILVGGWNLGVQRFDAKQDKFVSYFKYQPNDKNSLSANHVHNLLVDSKGRLWIGILYGSLNRYDPINHRMEHFTHDPNIPTSFSGKETFTILEDSEKVLWFGTFNSGLNRYDEKNNQFTSFQHDEKDSQSILPGIVNVLYEDSKNRFWIGNSSGLNLMDRTRKIFKRYTTKHGLPGDKVVGILEDNVGDLWISTNNGISRFTPDTGVFKNLDYSDGLQENLFILGATAKMADGEMYFGGANGVNSFYPAQMDDNHYIPNVSLTQFKLFNKPIIVGQNKRFKKEIFASKHLDLSYKDSSFTLEFSAFSYKSPTKNRYRYKLEGFDTQYNEVDSNQRFATYTNLNPGRYTFLVTASNNDGIWSNKGTSITIDITPPFWKTYWFRIIMALIIIGTLFSAYRMRVSFIHNRNRELETQVAERTYDLTVAKQQADAAKTQADAAKLQAEFANEAKSIFLAKMSHELRTPLNAILGFSELLTYEANNKQLALSDEQKNMLDLIQSSGEILLDLINNVLDLSIIESGKITLSLVEFDFYELLNEVENLFILKAQHKGILLRFEKSPNLLQYYVGDKMKIRQILINFMSNAVKFTEVGSIIVRITQKKGISEKSQIIKIEVEDSGLGIADNEFKKLFEPFSQTATGISAKEGTGLGLVISKELANLMGGQVEVKSEKGKGSVFIFTVELSIAEEKIRMS